VYVTLIGADIPRFVQAYSDFGLKENIPMLTSEDLVAQDAIRFYTGDAAIGITGITPFTANLDRPEMQTFVQAYQDRTGNTPTFWGESAYVAAMVAVLIGMTLVFRFFPRKDEEEALRVAYHAQDSGSESIGGETPRLHVPAPGQVSPTEPLP